MATLTTSNVITKHEGAKINQPVLIDNIYKEFQTDLIQEKKQLQRYMFVIICHHGLIALWDMLNKFETCSVTMTYDS